MTKTGQHDVAVVGLGVMGANLALNFASRGLSVAGYTLDLAQGRKVAADHPEAKLFVAESIGEMVMGEVKRTFHPEFINRLDEIIVFDALTDEDLSRITRLLVEQLNLNLKDKGITVAIRDDGVQWLLERTLKDRSYGARPLRRLVQTAIGDRLAKALLGGEVRDGDTVVVDRAPGSEGLTVTARR